MEDISPTARPIPSTCGREVVDGKPVTGQDFVDAFVRMFTTSGASSIYDAIQKRAEVRGKKADPSTLGVEGAPDDKTLVVTLTESDADFFGSADVVLFGAQRAHLIARKAIPMARLPKSMAYNGPFTLTEWSNQDKLVLKKNPNYGTPRYQARRGRLPGAPRSEHPAQSVRQRRTRRLHAADSRRRRRATRQRTTTASTRRPPRHHPEPAWDRAMRPRPASTIRW